MCLSREHAELTTSSKSSVAARLCSVFFMHRVLSLPGRLGRVHLLGLSTDEGCQVHCNKVSLLKTKFKSIKLSIRHQDLKMGRVRLIIDHAFFFGCCRALAISATINLNYVLN